MVKEIRGRSGAGSASAHGLAPQNLSPDKHVDVCVDSDEDRGSTPLASSLRFEARKAEAVTPEQRVGGLCFCKISPCLKDYGLAGQPTEEHYRGKCRQL